MDASPAARLSTREMLSALSGVLVAVTLAALDQNIVTTAMPAIARELHGLEHLSWVIVAYLLTSTACTPICGKLGDLYGRGRMMLIALAIFGGASVLCALAQNIGELIVARGLQGVGGGGLVVTSQAMIADFIAPRERGRFQAYTSMVWGAASIAGPALGGLLVDQLTWRWIFWINIPIGILALILSRRAMRRLHAPAVPHRIDYLGAALLMGAVTCLLLVSTWVGTQYTWTTPLVDAILSAGIVLLAAFVAWERRAAEPLLPPRLFRSDVVRLDNAISFIVAMLLFTGIVMLPVFFQLVKDVGAGSSGALLMPLVASSTTASFLSGQIIRFTGRYKWLMPAALTSAATGLGLLSTLDAATPLALPALYMVLLGFGIGACYPVLIVTVQNAAEPRDLGAATSTVAFGRSLGASFGAAIFWSILLATLGSRLADAGIAQVRAALFQGAQLPAAQHAVIVAALVHAFHVVFLIAAAVAAGGMLLSLRMRELPLKTTPRTDLREPVAPRSPELAQH